jgi:hypothetical protein
MDHGRPQTAPKFTNLLGLGGNCFSVFFWWARFQIAGVRVLINGRSAKRASRLF